MQDWWASLQPRERLMVGGLGVFLILTALYGFLLDPLWSNAAEYKERARSAERQLTWMQQAIPNLPATPQRRPVAQSGQSLNVIVDQTRNRYALVAANTQQVGGGQLRVRMEDARFDDIVKWLGDLRRDHGITITVANVTTTDVRGTTNATLTLSRGEP